MEIKIAENLRIETGIPLLNIAHVQLYWKPNEHAVLSLKGYIDNKIPYHLEQLYHSRLTLFLVQDKREQTIFCGRIAKAERSRVAGTEKISLCVLSGSCLLDQKEDSNSFQSIEKTYSEIARQAVENSGGNVICTMGKEKKLIQPLIQFEETAWGFARRLASHLESCTIPDIETGDPNLWFGMRKGKKIPDFSPEEYTVQIKPHPETKLHETSYRVESRRFYKIGDQTSFLGEPLIIVEVSACMRRGELFFSYLLKRDYLVKPIYQSKFAGLSLPGTILDTKEERIQVALKIDKNASTGNYYYPWYPKTGNALYAMPEIGAGIELYFPDVDERNGFISECIPEKKKKHNYEDRCFVLEDGNLIRLFENLLCFSKGRNQSVALRDGSITIGTSRQLQLSAKGKIRMRAKQIQVRSEDEITIYKG